jgi:hypothetical protein
MSEKKSGTLKRFAKGTANALKLREKGSSKRTQRAAEQGPMRGEAFDAGSPGAGRQSAVEQAARPEQGSFLERGGDRTGDSSAAAESSIFSSSSTSLQECLKVQIIQGKDLPAADSSTSSSDPYVEIIPIMSNGKGVTKCIKKTKVKKVTLNPVWHNERKVFGLEKLTFKSKVKSYQPSANEDFVDVNTIKSLLIKVWDKDLIGSNDLLGGFEIPINDQTVQNGVMEINNQIDEWYNLKQLNEMTGSAKKSLSGQYKQGKTRISAQGQLRVRIMRMKLAEDHMVNEVLDWEKTGAGDDFSSQKTGGVLNKLGMTKNQYEINKERLNKMDDQDDANLIELDVSCRPLLKLNIVSASGLMAGDINMTKNDSSDPYVLGKAIYYKGEDERKERQQTATIKKTCDPVWSEEKFVFGRESDLNAVKHIELLVMDFDFGQSDDELGIVTIDLDNVSAGVHIEGDFEIKPTTKMITSGTVVKHPNHPDTYVVKKTQQTLGKLHLSMRMEGKSNAATRRQAFSTVVQAELAENQIGVTVVQAKNLHSVFGANSEPYAKISCWKAKDQRGETSQVSLKGEAKDPWWNESINLTMPNNILSGSAEQASGRFNGVVIKVVAGENLIIADTGPGKEQTSDPYIEIVPVTRDRMRNSTGRGGGKVWREWPRLKQKSEVVEKNHLCPMWSKGTFQFYNQQVVNSGKMEFFELQRDAQEVRFRIRVRDDDSFQISGSDKPGKATYDEMGTFELKLSDFDPEGALTTRWVKLWDRKNSDKKQDSWTPASDLNDGGENHGKILIKYKIIRPDFVAHQQQATMHAQNSEKIFVDVFDHDKSTRAKRGGSGDQFIGRVQVPVSELKPGVRHRQWMPLETQPPGEAAPNQGFTADYEHQPQVEVTLQFGPERKTKIEEKPPDNELSTQLRRELVDKLSEQRYVLRKLKQEFRDDYRALMISELAGNPEHARTSVKMPSELVEDTLATLKIHIVGARNLPPVKKRVAGVDRGRSLGSNPFVRVYYKSADDVRAGVPWDEIMKKEKRGWGTSAKFYEPPKLLTADYPPKFATGGSDERFNKIWRWQDTSGLVHQTMADENTDTPTFIDKDGDCEIKLPPFFEGCTWRGQLPNRIRSLDPSEEMNIPILDRVVGIPDCTNEVLDRLRRPDGKLKKWNLHKRTELIREWTTTPWVEMNRYGDTIERGEYGTKWPKAAFSTGQTSQAGGADMEVYWTDDWEMPDSVHPEIKEEWLSGSEQHQLLEAIATAVDVGKVITVTRGFREVSATVIGFTENSFDECTGPTVSVRYHEDRARTVESNVHLKIDNNSGRDITLHWINFDGAEGERGELIKKDDVVTEFSQHGMAYRVRSHPEKDFLFDYVVPQGAGKSQFNGVCEVELNCELCEVMDMMKRYEGTSAKVVEDMNETFKQLGDLSINVLGKTSRGHKNYHKSLEALQESLTQDQIKESLLTGQPISQVCQEPGCGLFAASPAILEKQESRRFLEQTDSIVLRQPDKQDRIFHLTGGEQYTARQLTSTSELVEHLNTSVLANAQGGKVVAELAHIKDRGLDIEVIRLVTDSQCSVAFQSSDPERVRGIFGFTAADENKEGEYLDDSGKYALTASCFSWLSTNKCKRHGGGDGIAQGAGPQIRLEWPQLDEKKLGQRSKEALELTIKDLKVQVLSCGNLAKADTDLMGGKSDPYVKVFWFVGTEEDLARQRQSEPSWSTGNMNNYTGKRIYIDKTPFIENELNPEWDAEKDDTVFKLSGFQNSGRFQSELFRDPTKDRAVKRDMPKTTTKVEVRGSDGNFKPGTIVGWNKQLNPSGVSAPEYEILFDDGNRETVKRELILPIFIIKCRFEVYDHDVKFLQGKDDFLGSVEVNLMDSSGKMGIISNLKEVEPVLYDLDESKSEAARADYNRREKGTVKLKFMLGDFDSHNPGGTSLKVVEAPARIAQLKDSLPVSKDQIIKRARALLGIKKGGRISRPSLPKQIKPKRQLWGESPMPKFYYKVELLKLENLTPLDHNTQSDPYVKVMWPNKTDPDAIEDITNPYPRNPKDPKSWVGDKRQFMGTSRKLACLNPNWIHESEAHPTTGDKLFQPSSDRYPSAMVMRVQKRSANNGDYQQQSDSREASERTSERELHHLQQSRSRNLLQARFDRYNRRWYPHGEGAASVDPVLKHGGVEHGAGMSLSLEVFDHGSGEDKNFVGGEAKSSAPNKLGAVSDDFLGRITITHDMMKQMLGTDPKKAGGKPARRVTLFRYKGQTPHPPKQLPSGRYLASDELFRVEMDKADNPDRTSSNNDDYLALTSADQNKCKPCGKEVVGVGAFDLTCEPNCAKQNSGAARALVKLTLVEGEQADREYSKETARDPRGKALTLRAVREELVASGVDLSVKHYSSDLQGVTMQNVDSEAGMDDANSARTRRGHAAVERELPLWGQVEAELLFVVLNERKTLSGGHQSADKAFQAEHSEEMGRKVQRISELIDTSDKGKNNYCPAMEGVHYYNQLRNGFGGAVGLPSHRAAKPNNFHFGSQRERKFALQLEAPDGDAVTQHRKKGDTKDAKAAPKGKSVSEHERKQEEYFEGFHAGAFKAGPDGKASSAKPVASQKPLHDIVKGMDMQQLAQIIVMRRKQTANVGENPDDGPKIPELTEQNYNIDRLKLTVLECSNVLPADYNFMSANTSDPYVRVKWGEATKTGAGEKVQYVPQHSLGRTSQKLKTLFPKWNDSGAPEQFELPFDYPYGSGDKAGQKIWRNSAQDRTPYALRLEVFDHDDLSSDDLLGTVTLWEDDIVMALKGTADRGEVVVSISEKHANGTRKRKEHEVGATLKFKLELVDEAEQLNFENAANAKAGSKREQEYLKHPQFKAGKAERMLGTMKKKPGDKVSARSRSGAGAPHGRHSSSTGRQFSLCERWSSYSEMREILESQGAEVEDISLYDDSGGGAFQSNRMQNTPGTGGLLSVQMQVILPEAFALPAAKIYQAEMVEANISRLSLEEQATLATELTPFADDKMYSSGLLQIAGAKRTVISANVKATKEAVQYLEDLRVGVAMDWRVLDCPMPDSKRQEYASQGMTAKEYPVWGPEKCIDWEPISATGKAYPQWDLMRRVPATGEWVVDMLNGRPMKRVLYPWQDTGDPSVAAESPLTKEPMPDDGGRSFDPYDVAPNDPPGAPWQNLVLYPHESPALEGPAGWKNFYDGHKFVDDVTKVPRGIRLSIGQETKDLAIAHKSTQYHEGMRMEAIAKDYVGKAGKMQPWLDMNHQKIVPRRSGLKEHVRARKRYPVPLYFASDNRAEAMQVLAAVKMVQSALKSQRLLLRQDFEKIRLQTTIFTQRLSTEFDFLFNRYCKPRVQVGTWEIEITSCEDLTPVNKLVQVQGALRKQKGWRSKAKEYLKVGQFANPFVRVYVGERAAISDYPQNVSPQETHRVHNQLNPEFNKTPDVGKKRNILRIPVYKSAGGQHGAYRADGSGDFPDIRLVVMDWDRQDMHNQIGEYVITGGRQKYESYKGPTGIDKRKIQGAGGGSGVGQGAPLTAVLFAKGAVTGAINRKTSYNLAEMKEEEDDDELHANSSSSQEEVNRRQQNYNIDGKGKRPSIFFKAEWKPEAAATSYDEDISYDEDHTHSRHPDEVLKRTAFLREQLAVKRATIVDDVDDPQRGLKVQRDLVCKDLRDKFEEPYHQYVKPPPRGQLQVTVLEAVGLPWLDPETESDPFCVLELEGQMHRTATIHNQNNPKWYLQDSDNTFVFDVARAHSRLNLSLWDDDEDIDTEAAPMGEVEIPFEAFGQSGGGEQVMKLFLKDDIEKIRQREDQYDLLVERLSLLGSDVDGHGLDAEHSGEGAAVYSERMKLQREKDYLDGKFRKDGQYRKGMGRNYYPHPAHPMDNNPQGFIKVKLQYTPHLDARDRGHHVGGLEMHDGLKDPLGMQESADEILSCMNRFKYTMLDELKEHHMLPSQIRAMFGEEYSRHENWNTGTKLRPSDDSQACDITLRVIEGENLPVMDPLTGTSDTYCKVSIVAPENKGADCGWNATRCKKGHVDVPANYWQPEVRRQFELHGDRVEDPMGRVSDLVRGKRGAYKPDSRSALTSAQNAGLAKAGSAASRGEDKSFHGAGALSWDDIKNHAQLTGVASDTLQPRWGPPDREGKENAGETIQWHVLDANYADVQVDLFDRDRNSAGDLGRPEYIGSVRMPLSEVLERELIRKQLNDALVEVAPGSTLSRAEKRQLLEEALEAAEAVSEEMAHCDEAVHVRKVLDPTYEPPAAGASGYDDALDGGRWFDLVPMKGNHKHVRGRVKLAIEIKLKDEEVEESVAEDPDSLTLKGATVAERYAACGEIQETVQKLQRVTAEYEDEIRHYENEAAYRKDRRENIAGQLRDMLDQRREREEQLEIELEAGHDILTEGFEELVNSIDGEDGGGMGLDDYDRVVKELEEKNDTGRKLLDEEYFYIKVQEVGDADIRGDDSFFVAVQETDTVAKLKVKIERHVEGGLIAEKQILEYHGGSMWEDKKLTMLDHHSLAYYKILFTPNAMKHVIYVTTRKNNLSTEMNRLEVDLKRKQQCVTELSACSQEQALKMCDLIHVKYKQMDKNLDKVKDDATKCTKSNRALQKLLSADTLRKHDSVRNLERKLQQAKYDLRRVQAYNHAMKAEYAKNYHMVPSPISWLLGDSEVESSHYRVAGSHDPYPVHEQLLGSGVWQEHFEPLLDPINQGVFPCIKKSDVQAPLSPEDELM